MADSPPLLYLAPMQDVTDLTFMRVLTRFGGADVYVTEYFRVHEASRPDPWILRSIDENPTGKPIYAQMIGQDRTALVRTAQELLQHPVAGIDLNLGCPAPVVCKKEAGGGLLRNLPKIDAILSDLREAIPRHFTVKTRIGYHTPEEFEALLQLFSRHRIDALAIHARTVAEKYQTPIHPEYVAQAVATLPCPVIANGNIVNAAAGLAYHRQTAAAGLMIGRGAIRNPWIFDQLRAVFSGTLPTLPRCRELLDYVRCLYQEIAADTQQFDALGHVQRMKKTMLFVTQGFAPEFEFQLRRAKTESEFDAICRDFLDHDAPVPDLPPENSRLFCGFSELLRPAVSQPSSR
ncbi:tRNA-dihydrouridine synthase C [Haloferula luteola]|uniref:tRNA-dihydrouridine synthase n=1 Tax=Haloferula luteola TaxID=595692 RepID=A0A840V096_9BACT|nr:tRNA-dihydrouridine synthase family protein [Haloferula luteola]MBB5351432.1 tRNA-dihydrouridine synthase C [Haloferula luteola]